MDQTEHSTGTDRPAPDSPDLEHAAPPRGAGHRRSRRAGRRTRRVRFFVDDAEHAALDAAAHRDGISTGAWVATVAVAQAHLVRAGDRAAAAGHTPPAAPPGPSGKPGATPWVPLEDVLAGLVAARDELHLAWRQLRVVGGLLNQLARIANATDSIPHGTARTLETVTRATQGVHATGDRLAELLAECRTRL